MPKPLARPGFRNWADRQPDPGWGLMPITHITGGVSAEDIVQGGEVSLEECDIFKADLAYFFYGRPAYRIRDGSVVKTEVACPYCFVFTPEVVHLAREIYPFDTGAFAGRMYTGYVDDRMRKEDFSLNQEVDRVNKVIAALFSSRTDYMKGVTSESAVAGTLAEPWEFHARAYIELLTSRGRNEPDDRLCAVEIILDQPLPLEDYLKAVVVPHTIWGNARKAPWLRDLDTSGVHISTYDFVPGRHQEYYHAQLERAVTQIYLDWGAVGNEG
jgi:hypothetical protein